jgi:hypothetical protein
LHTKLIPEKMKWKVFIAFIIAGSLVQIAPAQNKKKDSDKPVTITGKVINQDNNPVAGAVLYIDNIRTSNITKDDGSYKIKVSPSATNLEVRSSQYGSCKTPIADHSVINFALNGAEGIASFSSIKEKDIVQDDDDASSKAKGKRMNTYSDIYQMIRGEVSGVVVSGRSVQIQQGHSFFGGSAPLYVVNGGIVQSIDNINPLEVKSIKVLKGSQAAVYGVQGSNGVISITLINGSDKPKE